MHEAERGPQVRPAVAGPVPAVLGRDAACGSLRSATPTRTTACGCRGPAAAPGAGDGPDGHVGDSEVDNVLGAKADFEIRTSPGSAAGLMFWFAVKRLVGSYFCFSAASRS